MLTFKNVGYNKEQAKEYNNSVYNARINNTGCISTLACINCYCLVTDSLCICSGNFTCPNCNFKNGFDFSKYNFTESELLAKSVINIPKDFYNIVYRKHETDRKQRICKVCGLSDIECTMEVTKKCYGSKRNLEKEIEEELGVLEWV